MAFGFDDSLLERKAFMSLSAFEFAPRCPVSLTFSHKIELADGSARAVLVALGFAREQVVLHATALLLLMDEKLLKYLGAVVELRSPSLKLMPDRGECVSGSTENGVKRLGVEDGRNESMNDP